MMVKEIVLCFLLYCQFIRIVKMCLSSINNWRKSRWTHEVVIEIVVAVEIVVVLGSCSCNSISSSTRQSTCACQLSASPSSHANLVNYLTNKLYI